MKDIAIVTDSNSGITQKQAKDLGVTVVPMPFYIDGEMYLEDINLSQEEFYEKLKSDAKISTSQPSPGDVTGLWEQLLAEGYDLGETTQRVAASLFEVLDGFEYYGTSVMTSTRLKEITENGAIVMLPGGEEVVIPADTVIMSVGYRSSMSIAEELKGCTAKIYEIGDSRKVGNILTCISDAYKTALSI